MGQDGLLCIFELRDRDPRAAKKNISALPFSTEILTEHSEMEKLNSELDSKQIDYNQLKTSDESQSVEKELEVKKLKEKLTNLQDRLESDKQDAKQKKESYEQKQVEQQNANENKKKDLLDYQQEVIEQKRNEYSRKMLEDSGRFNQLQVEKEEDRLTYQNALDKLQSDHAKSRQGDENQHNKEIEVKNTQIEHLMREIDSIQKDNSEIIDQIKADTKLEI